MMRWLGTLVVMVAVVSTVHAQPGATPPTAYAPPPPNLQLTAEDEETLSIGYVSDGQLFGGGVASLFFGLGVGQAVQGRWHDTGWIFTLGEPVAATVFVYGLVRVVTTCDEGTSCHASDGSVALTVGAIALVGLRLWEIVDAFVGPGRQNERFRAVQMKLGNPSPVYARPFVAPSSGGAIAGITLRF